MGAPVCKPRGDIDVQENTHTPARSPQPAVGLKACRQIITKGCEKSCRRNDGTTVPGGRTGGEESPPNPSGRAPKMRSHLYTMGQSAKAEDGLGTAEGHGMGWQWIDPDTQAGARSSGACGWQ